MKLNSDQRHDVDRGLRRRERGRRDLPGHARLPRAGRGDGAGDLHRAARGDEKGGGQGGDRPARPVEPRADGDVRGRATRGCSSATRAAPNEGGATSAYFDDIPDAQRTRRCSELAEALIKQKTTEVRPRRPTRTATRRR